MKTMEFTVTQTIPAPLAEVFDQWIDPASAQSPWVGDGDRSVNAIVGGLFFWSDKNWTDQVNGGDWPHYGRFLRVERPTLLEYTWVSEFTHGLDSIVTVTFQPVGNLTEVTLRHRGLPDGKDGLEHKNAWIRILGEVASHYAYPEHDAGQQ